MRDVEIHGKQTNYLSANELNRLSEMSEEVHHTTDECLKACKLIICNEMKVYFTSQVSLLYFTPLM